MRLYLGRIVSLALVLMPNLVTVKDEVRDKKAKAFRKPSKYLYPVLGKKYPPIKEIFNHLHGLKYEDKPDYHLIK